jgi:hypothetical protein
MGQPEKWTDVKLQNVRSTNTKSVLVKCVVHTQRESTKTEHIKNVGLLFKK